MVLHGRCTDTGLRYDTENQFRNATELHTFHKKAYRRQRGRWGYKRCKAYYRFWPGFCKDLHIWYKLCAVGKVCWNFTAEDNSQHGNAVFTDGGSVGYCKFFAFQRRKRTLSKGCSRSASCVQRMERSCVWSGAYCGICDTESPGDSKSHFGSISIS